MRVLVIVPHMDDEVLGCGMAISMHVRRGDQVGVLVVSNRAYGQQYCGPEILREMECCREAKGALGYQTLMFGYDDTPTGLLPDQEMYTRLNQCIALVEKRVKEFKPDMCYVPWGGDVNQDHRTLYDACMVALRPAGVCQNVNMVLSFEVPSSTELIWQARSEFRPSVYVTGSIFLEDKMKAWLCYPNEQRESPNGRSPSKIEALAEYRGARCGTQYAEGFVCELFKLQYWR